MATATTNAWIQRAEPLADWAWTWLAVRKDVFGKYKPDGGQITAHDALTREILIRSFQGLGTIGCHSISVDGRCKSVALDIDAHDDKADSKANWRCALRSVELFAGFGLKALIFDSNGHGGYHVRAFFKKPIAAAVAYWVCERVKAILQHEGHHAPEAFPKQATLTLDCPYGNWLRIPGKHHKREHWTRIWDAERVEWLEDEAAVKRLLSVAGDRTGKLLEVYKETIETEGEAAKDEPHPWEIPVTSSTKGNNPGHNGRGRNGEKPDAARVLSALNMLPADWASDYDRWLNVGMALHHWDSSQGLALWHEFSRLDQNRYDPGVCDSKWATFSSGGANCFTVLSIFKEAWSRGWTPPRDEPPPTASRNGHANGVGPKPASNGKHQADDEDAEDEPILDRWPVCDEHAFHGIAGDIVRMADPHSEADQIATLVQLLIAFPNMLGRKAHFIVGATHHYLNLFGVMVGATGSGRKGTSWDVVKWVLSWLDPQWKTRITDGMSSGEGLIHAVRDPRYEDREVKETKGRKSQPAPATDPDNPWANGPAVSTSGRTTERVLVDAGVEDKRLMVVEPEFARPLKAMGRDGNTLSAVIRQGYDSGDLNNMVKNNPDRATNAHISIIGHATYSDIRKYLTGNDAVNGFANRFLWVCVRRSKLLPSGGDLFGANWGPLRERMLRVRSNADQAGRMRRDEAAEKIWEEVYGQLSLGKVGLIGDILGRAEPMVMRLACVYALLDESAIVRGEHMIAALALWKYCEDSTRFIFGDDTGDPAVTKLLDALRVAPEGLTRTQIANNVFAKNKKRQEIADLLSELLTLGVIHGRKHQGEKGRPTERWFLGRAPKGGTE